MNWMEPCSDRPVTFGSTTIRFRGGEVAIEDHLQLLVSVDEVPSREKLIFLAPHRGHPDGLITSRPLCWLR